MKRYIITLLTFIPSIVLGMEEPARKKQKIISLPSVQVQNSNVLSAKNAASNILQKLEKVTSKERLPKICREFWDTFKENPDSAKLVLEPLMEDWQETRNKPWLSIKLKTFFQLCEKAPESSKDYVAGLIARNTDKFTKKKDPIDLSELSQFNDNEIQKTFLITSTTVQRIVGAAAKITNASDE